MSTTQVSEADRIVQDFERSRSRRAKLVAALLVLVFAAYGVVFFGVHGPTDNPVQAFMNGFAADLLPLPPSEAHQPLDTIVGNPRPPAVDPDQDQDQDMVTVVRRPSRS
jgi:hypothetical protein